MLETVSNASYVFLEVEARGNKSEVDASSQERQRLGGNKAARHGVWAGNQKGIVTIKSQ